MMSRTHFWLIVGHVSFVGLLVQQGQTKPLLILFLFDFAVATWVTFKK